ncbi:hypothetical protein AQS8620_02777 [Aquimixticola soesokkakensis]|uniref:Uncharacterized protein n=1 Tax=Aquimixticola soesokkakensis TaxID=1519096 RepID=A0A1Y5TDF8_9RHOB|nr:hypothetical protein [Aquimixticola soesokkakensis]SLN61065.1 hypothetical protein AQS8620_02777 [Aquimixticola soesokkakensis]
MTATATTKVTPLATPATAGDRASPHGAAWLDYYSPDISAAAANSGTKPAARPLGALEDMYAYYEA